MEDDYAELQFVERNAAVETRRYPGGSPNRTGRRTYYAQVPRHAAQQMFYPQPGLGIGVGCSPLFAGMTTGQVIDMVAQIFAALMPLPAAPVATSEAATDVGNLILYQSSLAQYAKRDEQVRTLGNLITKLVG
jgi:hypothetical protein